MAATFNLNNLPKFIRCTAATYAGLATKDANALYFLTDSGLIYQGSKLYSFNVVKSAAAPSGTGVGGTIYYNTTTGVASIWDGSAFIALGVATEEELTAASTHAKVATAKAVVDYVAGVKSAIESDAAAAYLAKGTSMTNNNLFAISSNGGAVADSGYGIGGTTTIAGTANKLATEAGVKAYVENEIADAITALGSFLKVKETVATVAALPATGNEPGDVRHVTENAGEYLWDGTAWQELGIDLSNYMQKVSGATAGDVATLNANGEVIDSGKKVGGSTLAASPDANTLATEAAVKAYADSVVGGANYIEKISGTNGHLVTLADNGKAIADSNKSVGGATLAASPNANTVATEAAVAAADAAKMDLVGSATANDILTVNAAGQAVDSGKAFKASGDLASTDTNATVPTSNVVYNAISDAIALFGWQDLSGN